MNESKNVAIYYEVGGELNVHFTSYEPKYDAIMFQDMKVMVLRYQRRGEMIDTIMPLAKIAYITEG